MYESERLSDAQKIFPSGPSAVFDEYRVTATAEKLDQTPDFPPEDDYEYVKVDIHISNPSSRSIDFYLLNWEVRCMMTDCDAMMARPATLTPNIGMNGTLDSHQTATLTYIITKKVGLKDLNVNYSTQCGGIGGPAAYYFSLAV